MPAAQRALISVRRLRAESRLFNYAAFVFAPTCLVWIVIWLRSEHSGWAALAGFCVTAAVTLIWPALRRVADARIRWRTSRWRRAWVYILGAILLYALFDFSRLDEWGFIALMAGVFVYAAADALTRARPAGDGR